MVAKTQLVSPQKLSDGILQCVRSSNLHFTIQETPFSLYITVRKKLFREVIEAPTETEELKRELTIIKEKFKNIEQENREFKHLIDKKENELKHCENVVQDLTQKLEKAKAEIKEVKARNNDTIKKHDVLVNTNKKVHEDLVRSKSESENLKLDLRETKKALKTKEKEEIRISSKMENLESSLKNLKQEIKEAVHEKNKMVKENLKLQNQILKVKERKPSVSRSTTTIAYSSEASTSTIGSTTLDSKMVQTDHHPDIPYEIQLPLPPIFNSSLVHKSKPIFFSRSHPNLATIRWLDITENDLIEDEIEQYEMEKYDREIKEFYEESAEKSKALREIFEGELIKNLFEEC